MIKTDYLFSTSYRTLNEFVPSESSSYIYGYSTEGRSRAVNELIKDYDDQVSFIGIQEDERKSITTIGGDEKYLLRSSSDIKKFIRRHFKNKVYLDISGLSNRVSAVLLKNFFSSSFVDSNISVIYMEPDKYKVKSFKSEGVFHDLSEKIDGVEPLPGFATIVPDDGDEFEFIALLGFEGGRFTQMIEIIQPTKDNIYPVIGVPGFRIEYPQIAYWGNKEQLKKDLTWSNVKFIQANSIVESFRFLNKRANRAFLNNKRLKVAPIGTKPHAIGAILCAIKNDNVELVYDNPSRIKERTEGIGNIIVSDISGILGE